MLGNSPGQQVERGSSLIFPVSAGLSFTDVIIAELMSGVFVTKTRGSFVTGRDVLLSFILACQRRIEIEKKNPNLGYEEGVRAEQQGLTLPGASELGKVRAHTSA